MVTKNYALSSDSLQIVYSFGVTGMGPVSLLSFKMRRSFVMLHPFAVAISGFCAFGCAAIERCEENQLPSYWRAWWWSAHWSRSRHSNQPDDQLQSPFWFYFPIFVTFLLLSCCSSARNARSILVDMDNIHDEICNFNFSIWCSLRNIRLNVGQYGLNRSWILSKTKSESEIHTHFHSPNWSTNAV